MSCVRISLSCKLITWISYVWISLSYKLISHIRCVWICLTSCEKISLTSGGRVGAGVGRRSKERCCIDRRHSCRDETVQNSVYKHGASPLLHAFQSEVWFEKYRLGKYLGRNSGNRSLGEISGAILGREWVRRDRIVCLAEK